MEATWDVAAGMQAAPAIIPYCFPPSVANEPTLPPGGQLVSDQRPDFGDLTVLSVLRRYLPRFLTQHPHALSADQAYVLQRILQCRTPALGAFVWECRWCGHKHLSYNACRNRHCPGCGPLRRHEWLERVLGWSLPTSYLHIVITQPPLLEALVLANPALLYRLLFRAAQQTITTIGRELFHVDTGSVIMLHTWGQPMDLHVHVHIIQTAGGLLLDGSGWVVLSADDEAFSKENLGTRFRELYLAGLVKLFRSGKLVLPPSMAWIQSEQDFQRWLAPIARIDWHAHCQGPPPGCEGPAAALSYLARYVGGSAISDSRILADDGQTVVILLKNYREGGAFEPLAMPGEEFVRRFLLHILPRRMHRLHYGGLFSPEGRKQRLGLARQRITEQNLSSPPPLAPQREATDHGGQELFRESEPHEQSSPEAEAEDNEPSLADEPQQEDEREYTPTCPRCLMPGMKAVGHFTARQLAPFLLHLHFFWQRAATVIVTLPYDRRAFRHAPQMLDQCGQHLAWGITTIDIDLLPAPCDAPPPDT